MLAVSIAALAFTLAVLAVVHLIAEAADATRTEGFIRPAFGVLVALLVLTGVVSFAYDVFGAFGGVV